MNDPKISVSVIVPAYNARRFLRGAIENIIEQEHRPLEIIVVDDGSTDGAADLAAEHADAVKLFRQSNQGPAAARNRGLREAAGDAIAFLDADDRWPAGALQRQAAVLAAHPEIQIVQGLIQDLHADDPDPNLEPAFEPTGRPPYASVNLGASLIRRVVFQSVGLLDESMRLHEDGDWFFRAWENNIPKLIVEHVTLYYRKHSGNVTNGLDLQRAGFALLYKKRLDRRRAGQCDASPDPGRPKAGEYFGWDYSFREKGCLVNSPQSISVVVPVFNGERYLPEALQSVLAQGYPRLEIIVVDDGSTDGSAAAAESFPGVRCIRQDNLGAGAARNRGAAEAQGDLLAFLDADDIWLPDKLSRQAGALADDRELEMVFGRVEQFHSPELTAEERQRIHIPVDVSSGPIIGAMLIRMQSFVRVGPLKTDVQVGEFIDWHARAVELGVRSLMMPETMVRRRLHTTNLGIRSRDHHGDYARIIKAALDRRRRA